MAENFVIDTEKPVVAKIFVIILPTKPKFKGKIKTAQFISFQIEGHNSF